MVSAGFDMEVVQNRQTNKQQTGRWKPDWPFKGVGRVQLARQSGLHFRKVQMTHRRHHLVRMRVQHVHIRIVRECEQGFSSPCAPGERPRTCDGGRSRLPTQNARPVGGACHADGGRGQGRSAVALGHSARPPPRIHPLSHLGCCWFPSLSLNALRKEVPLRNLSSVMRS